MGIQGEHPHSRLFLNTLGTMLDGSISNYYCHYILDLGTELGSRLGSFLGRQEMSPVCAFVSMGF